MNSTPDTKPTMEDVVNSLDGFDEIAIEKHFGATVEDMLEQRPIRGARALHFVLARRDGKTDPEAYQHAMGVKVGALNDAFADDDDEDDLMPEEPETDAGKGGSSRSGKPTGSPPSA